MYHIKEPRGNFSTASAFKASSEWATHINNIQFETFLAKLEEKLISINRNDKSYSYKAKKY